MEAKFKHKVTGEIGYYKDGIFKQGNCCVEIGVPPSSEFWEEVFITEDGVELYKGGKYYSVYTTSIGWSISGPYTINIDAEDFMHDNVKYFAEKTKAEEYVKQNAPKYSLKDVEDAMSGNYFNSLGGVTIKESILTILELSKNGK